MKTTIVLVAVLLATPTLAGQPAVTDPFQGLVDIRKHQIVSEAIGEQYEIMVSLPAGYAESPDTEYPTLYVTDGASLFALLQGYYRYLTFGEEVPELIFVAISYSDSDWVNGNNRGRDYSAPSDERDDWGGAGNFQAMLRDEIMPFVEKTYRSQEDRRIVFGQSMGGQFVMYTAHTEPGLFWGHIASNPALHHTVDFFLPANTEIPTKPLTRLFVASASDDAPRFKEPAMQWISEWTNRQQRPWDLRVEFLEGHNHYSPPPDSFRLGMKWLFSSVNIPRPAGD